jgi:hypothetical protein
LPHRLSFDVMPDPGEVLEQWARQKKLFGPLFQRGPACRRYRSAMAVTPAGNQM